MTAPEAGGGGRGGGGREPVSVYWLFSLYPVLCQEPVLTVSLFLPGSLARWCCQVMSSPWPSHEGLAHLMPAPALTVTHVAAFLSPEHPERLLPGTLASPGPSAWHLPLKGMAGSFTLRGTAHALLSPRRLPSPTPFKAGPFLDQPVFS